jgi:hypothetical protein
MHPKNSPSNDVTKLAADDTVTKRKGIVEFLLGGSVDTKLLEVRVFANSAKRAAYARRKDCLLAGERITDCTELLPTFEFWIEAA